MGIEGSHATVAFRLRIAEKGAGLSQGQAAKILDLHRPTISEIEAGRRRVSVEELGRFADIYGVDVEWLASGTKTSSEQRARVEVAARQLSKLKSGDLEKVVNLLTALRKRGASNGL